MGHYMAGPSRSPALRPTAAHGWPLANLRRAGLPSTSWPARTRRPPICHEELKASHRCTCRSMRNADLQYRSRCAGRLPDPFLVLRVCRRRSCRLCIVAAQLLEPRPHLAGAKRGSWPATTTTLPLPGSRSLGLSPLVHLHPGLPFVLQAPMAPTCMDAAQPLTAGMGCPGLLFGPMSQRTPLPIALEGLRVRGGRCRHPGGRTSDLIRAPTDFRDHGRTRR